MKNAFDPLPAGPASDISTLISRRALKPCFQPLVELATGKIHAHEALIRGPAGSALERPDALFAAAREAGLETELEFACLHAAIREWARLRHPGKIFINLSARALVQGFFSDSCRTWLSVLHRLDIAPSSIVLELTEHEHVGDVQRLVHAASHLRASGIALALDDFGDGRSSLRLWSELRPQIVKIDKYFSHEISLHGDKLQTLRALLQIAEIFGTKMVAEGIETAEDLRVIRDLGIALGQGYFLGMPRPRPTQALDPDAAAVLTSRDIAVFPELRRIAGRSFPAERFIVNAPHVPPQATHDELLRLFHQDERLPAVALVENGRPVGLLNRQQLLDQYTKPYFKELYGRQPCVASSNRSPLCIELYTSVEELTAILTSEDQRYLREGFVITDQGRYRGLGTGEQLVRVVTELRIEAARHANPLTFLPGNIPISDHIDRLLASGSDFVACYGDLNHFKPFNDQYGYWRGDEMIRLAARAFLTHCDPKRDFLGHVGGDDFVVLFQSRDWRERCERVLQSFNEKALELYDAQARTDGGIHAEDRYGVMRFFPCTTLSIGAVEARGGMFHDAEEVATAAAAAKRSGKALGSGLHLIAVPPLPQVAAARETA
ncbi:phosphodiesterase [Caldimonas tepidiphila]|uniref:phosphodiesterase n=1 Tax=Caldimonas tepidiphila TaxID=2315841 RepID=UPI000E5C1EBC|nr:phosphodiesterase [Caldimonas tepidiphila]